jgi:site-specific DNA-methyltransferase (adenine-specific)
MKNQIIYVDPTTLIENQVVTEIYPVTENYQSILENIKAMGVLEPLLVDEHNVVISGNLRRQIAIELGITSVPVIVCDNGGLDTDALKLKAVSHAQQRIKTYSQLFKEYEILNELYPVKKGERTDLDPAKKSKKEKRDSLNISKAKLGMLKSIKELATELYSEDTAEYKNVWNEVDTQKASLNRIVKGLKRTKIERANNDFIPSSYEVIAERIKIYNKSCEQMLEIEDGEIACIITSPPYFQMRDYGTGVDQRGLEKDVDSFIKGLVSDFRDCKRVLADDGSLWVNLGEAVIDGHYNAIPHKFVLAMMEDGWIFNDEIIWVKNNPVFTQAKRTVRAHEYIFHFVKSSNYKYDISWLSNLSDPNDLISYGTSGKISNLMSSMDFRENIIRTNSNNMEKLRRECSDKGFHLTHGAAFPLTIPLILILTTTSLQSGDTVLDIYSGTATTGEAAAMTGRKYIGYEIKPEYIMASEVRLAEYLGNDDSNLLAA